MQVHPELLPIDLIHLILPHYSFLVHRPPWSATVIHQCCPVIRCHLPMIVKQQGCMLLPSLILFVIITVNQHKAIEVELTYQAKLHSANLAPISADQRHKWTNIENDAHQAKGGSYVSQQVLLGMWVVLHSWMFHGLMAAHCSLLAVVTFGVDGMLGYQGRGLRGGGRQ